MKSEFEKFYLSQNPWGRSQLDAVQREQMKRVPANYINPHILEERSLNVTSLDIYSRLQLDRLLFLNTSITEETANVLVAQLLFLHSVDHKPITLHISSGGGSVYSGYEIISTMELISESGSPVNTIVLSMAASMAAVITACGIKRSALKRSRIMIHQPLGSLGEGMVQATDIQIEAQEITKLKNELYELLSEKTGQPKERLEKDCERDYWLKDYEAVEYGLIDEIITKI